MKTNLNNLVLEVTRRCNLECGHCLRGDPQNRDLDIDVIYALFNRVNYISEISFTGGEPSIAAPHIDRILSVAKEKNVEIGNFYLATNAVEISDYFLRTIFDWWLYCSDNETTALHWSNSYYHDSQGCPENNRKKLSAFKFAGPKHEEDSFDFRYYDPSNAGGSSGLVMDGRGRYQTNRGKDEFISPVPVEYYDNSATVEELIYITVDGTIISGCDFSYETMEREAVQIGTIFGEDLLKQIDAFNERTPSDLTVSKLPEKVK